MTYTIETGIPMPEVGRKGKPIKYPLRDLEIGQSFFVSPCDEKMIASVRARATMVGKLSGMKFTATKMEDGLRVWRVS